jgi:predicted Zn finger-like uncharacterized protein
MAIKTNCPHCDQAYTLVDEQAGKKIRCKACTTVFEVPAADERRLDAPRRGRPDDFDDRDEEYRPRRRGRRAGVPVWVWLLIGGGVLLVLMIVGVVVVLFATGTLGNKITEENFAKLKAGMSEAEVKAILGPPTEVNDIGIKAANPFFPGGLGVRVLTWRHGQNQVIVGFLNDQATQITGSFTRK